MTERVDRAERLLNLVFALMATPRPVPRAAIRAQVPGYSEAASDSSFERMFERDKDELRSMAIPIETVLDDFGEVQGYRIPRDAYAMEPMDLSLEERSAIAVAARVWGHAQVAPVAGTAVSKMQSISADPGSWGPADLHGGVQITASDAALLPLMSAIRLGRVVTFDYRAPSSEGPARRTVSPWRVATRDGHWMVSGWDHDREATRTFRLSRIAGAVVVTSQERVGSADHGARDPEVEETSISARVRVAPGHAAAVRRLACPPASGWESDEFEVVAASAEALVAAVCSAGGHAHVLAPAEFVEAQRQAWERILAAHSGQGS